VLGHPRLIEVRFHNSAAEIWEGLARHGRPIQYAYVSEPLALWDTWTRIAGQPVAFEPPSAGFILDWTVIRSLRARGARAINGHVDRTGQAPRTGDCHWHNSRAGPGACRSS
jgi:hypothetical protein